eukprot:scaffold403755_cov28-Attheya_sp.AAC.1
MLGGGNNFETTHWTGIPCVRLRSLTVRTCRGPGGEAPVLTMCYARLPEEVMIFEHSLWPQA